MGSFSIWHWIILLIIFSPVIFGIAVMGFQRKVLIRHPQSGLTKNGFMGWCWTYCLFGWLVPIFRGEIGIGALHLLLTCITFGLFQLIMSFLYNKQYMTRKLLAGWVLADTEQNNQYARIKLGIAG